MSQKLKFCLIITQQEEKLRAANRAEKPLEESGTVAESEKALKTTEELARCVD
jgi:hypothetical protein